LSVSPGTVMREWTLIKAWFQREMRRGDHECNPEKQ